jgi:uncharacterized protein YvpB
MSATAQRRIAARRRTVLRRRTFALAALAGLAGIAALLLLGGGAPSRRGQPGFLTLSLDGRTLARRPVADLRGRGAIAALLASVPAGRTVRHGPTAIDLRTERAALSRELARAAREGGGAVTVPERPAAARTRVPLVRQALRDNCETASLSMVLAFRGRAVGQLALQGQVAHSRPLDPSVSAQGQEVWGDPNRGFVGRADGGGPGGGFGVYQRPIEALAKRHGVELRDLTGASPKAVYRALLSGRPVLAWVALSDGPFASWQTPAGRTVRVNYGEHAVVLTGVGPGSVSLNEPLSGRRLTWAKPDFERMWAGLGRRALST